MIRWSIQLVSVVLLAGLAVLTGCTYPARNQVATVVGDRHGYQLEELAPDDMPKTLVIVTASGGGTRATALALSVLRGLDKITLPNDRSLAQEIDLISSVSGGSVAAGYFALTGREGFGTLEHDFVRQDGINAILSAGLNPVGLFKLSTPGTERIDLLIDFLDRQLFHGATFATLLKDKRRPLLVLNAADMVEGTPFAFSQRNFDLLCSDLPSLPLATAVAASAAFPVALSPVTLKNYQPCAATERIANWPPPWVTAPLDNMEAPFAQPSPWYSNPQRTAVARTEYGYALGDKAPPDDKKLYIHLLDGGIADNLGIAAPFRMLTTRNANPPFLQDIDTGRITKLIFVVTNARSFKTSALNESQATPSAVDMLVSSISAPIDRTTAGVASQLRDLLLDQFRQIMLGDPVHEERFHHLAENTALISVDFDAIADPSCRRKFHNIPTSWTLKPKHIDGVLKMGEALLGNDPAFADMLKIVGAKRPSLPTLEEACSILAL